MCSEGYGGRGRDTIWEGGGEGEGDFGGSSEDGREKGRGEEGGRCAGEKGSEGNEVDRGGVEGFGGDESSGGVEKDRRGGERDADGLDRDVRVGEIFAEVVGEGTSGGDAVVKAGGVAVVLSEEDGYGADGESRWVRRHGDGHEDGTKGLVENWTCLKVGDRRRGAFK